MSPVTSPEESVKVLLHHLVLLVHGEEGQDLVEYGLLGLFLGLAGLLAWSAIAAGIGTSYVGYDSDVQGLWEPRDP
jgi:hypothetical protein